SIEVGEPQWAVSGAFENSEWCRLPVGETAGWQPALRGQSSRTEVRAPFAKRGSAPIWTAATCRRFPTGRHVCQFQSAVMPAHSKLGHYPKRLGVDSGHFKGKYRGTCRSEAGLNAMGKIKLIVAAVVVIALASVMAWQHMSNEG